MPSFSSKGQLPLGAPLTRTSSGRMRKLPGVAGAVPLAAAGAGAAAAVGLVELLEAALEAECSGLFSLLALADSGEFAIETGALALCAGALMGATAPALAGKRGGPMMACGANCRRKVWLLKFWLASKPDTEA